MSANGTSSRFSIVARFFQPPRCHLAVCVMVLLAFVLPLSANASTIGKITANNLGLVL